jgi:hypothetical protein
MDRMFVAAVIFHDKAVAFAFLHGEQWIGLGPSFSCLYQSAINATPFLSSGRSR